jgi:benzodiazapine receptor
MENGVTGTDKIQSFLVLAATLGMIGFNWMAATGRLSVIDARAISDRYATLITPAEYAFSIWTLIYLLLLVFSVYQLLPGNVARFRPFRSLYILSCALNCAWLYFWYAEQIVFCFGILTALTVTLLFINYLIREPESLADTWIAKAPFGIYFGWTTSATLVNFVIMFKFLNVTLSPSMETALAVALILVAALFAIVVRLKLVNYFYPLAVAWALTAIAVKQSGHAIIVTSAAAGVVACLIASLSFVINLPSTQNREA